MTLRACAGVVVAAFALGVFDPALAADAAPARFPMPMDSGPRLLDDLAQARADLAYAIPFVDVRAERRVELERRWEELQARLARFARTRRAVVRELRAARERVQRVATEAYVHAGSSQLGKRVETFLSASDVVDFARDRELLDRYNDEQLRVLDDYMEKKEAADREIEWLTDQRTKLQVAIEDADSDLAAAQRAVDDARRRISEATSGLARFHASARTSASPIRGPNLLTAEDLAAFVRASGNTPRLTVSIDELARIYIEESNDAGVRGDVAWAQSILETGWFTFPSGGLVDSSDNNFAGIGACDSCAHGFRFDDARTGVRAQMQALRIYADDTVGTRSFAHPVVLPGLLRLGFRGNRESWWSLTGTWATGAGYGNHLYGIYRRMVASSGRGP